MMMLSLMPTLVLAVTAHQIVLPEANQHFTISCSPTWQVLGPFKIGTREAVWGADPLEALGGFGNLTYNRHDSYPSPLTPNATLKWSDTAAAVTNTSTGSSVKWDINHSNVDWQFMQTVYGWSALQYSTWVRGTIHNHHATVLKVNLYFDSVLEYSINGRYVFGGDFYGFKRAPHFAILQPGDNLLDVRLIREVRSMGGIGSSHIEAGIRIEKVPNDVQVLPNSLVAPEHFRGRLSSQYFGITIQNHLDDEITLLDCPHSESDLKLLERQPVSLASGQARPVALHPGDPVGSESFSSKPIFVTLCYLKTTIKPWDSYGKISFVIVIKSQKDERTHKMTFMHPSGVVSYAIVRPPDIVNTARLKTPVLLVLHGAGVEADSLLSRTALNDIHDLEAISILPTGLSPWCGDDWYTWGMSDALAAIDALSEWGLNVQWDGPPVDSSRFLVAGHSNGGQGTWYLATHVPDRVLAAAPASGYTSIENYVPFDLWAISEQNLVLSRARMSFRNELFVRNLASIPIMQQHGSLDDNVPPYHSRLMKSYSAQLGFESRYVEVLGRKHYWDGALATAPLQAFYKQNLNQNNHACLPVPNDFEFVTADSDDFGSKFGLVVDQLTTHDRLGIMRVSVDPHNHTLWYLKPSNIRRFHFSTAASLCRPPKFFSVDGGPPKDVSEIPWVSLSRREWIRDELELNSLSARTGRQRGALEAILRSQGPCQIVAYTGNNSSHDRDAALQISQNMLQYFGAASDILSRAAYDEAIASKGNVITVVASEHPPKALLSNFPISFHSDGIVLKLKNDEEATIAYSAGQGAVFLRPLPDERLEMVVWGRDGKGLEQAVRLVPTWTGAGQPDLAILSDEARSLGVGGAEALGFFDHDWSVSAASYV